jgi:hypothetical protein
VPLARTTENWSTAKPQMPRIGAGRTPNAEEPPGYEATFVEEPTFGTTGHVRCTGVATGAVKRPARQLLAIRVTSPTVNPRSLMPLPPPASASETAPLVSTT